MSIRSLICFCAPTIDFPFAFKIKSIFNTANESHIYFYRCTEHFDIHKVHSPTNALFIKLDKVLKIALKITSACSYMFRSATIIREPSLEPGSNEGSLMMVVDRNM